MFKTLEPTKVAKGSPPKPSTPLAVSSRDCTFSILSSEKLQVFNTLFIEIKFTEKKYHLYHKELSSSPNRKR
jgi:hypothetical protein